MGVNPMTLNPFIQVWPVADNKMVFEETGR